MLFFSVFPRVLLFVQLAHIFTTNLTFLTFLYKKINSNNNNNYRMALDKGNIT